MAVKLRPTEQIILLILRGMFMKDLKIGKIVPSDTITWLLRDKMLLETHFNSWLQREGYAE
jgi:hypothetical protein